MIISTAVDRGLSWLDIRSIEIYQGRIPRRRRTGDNYFIGELLPLDFFDKWILFVTTIFYSKAPSYPNAMVVDPYHRFPAVSFTPGRLRDIFLYYFIIIGLPVFR